MKVQSQRGNLGTCIAASQTCVNGKGMRARTSTLRAAGAKQRHEVDFFIVMSVLSLQSCWAEERCQKLGCPSLPSVPTPAPPDRLWPRTALWLPPLEEAAHAGASTRKAPAPRGGLDNQGPNPKQRTYLGGKATKRKSKEQVKLSQQTPKETTQEQDLGRCPPPTCHPQHVKWSKPRTRG